jgi:succinyl-diaminopimelate desuccinylase
VVTLNRRFAPDRTEAEAEAEVRALLAPVLEAGDDVRVVDSAPAAAPGLDNWCCALIDDTTSVSRPSRLDVARFAAEASRLQPGRATRRRTPPTNAPSGPR